MTDWIGAGSAVVATVVGILAAIYAWLQWRQAREQVQPQVSVFMEVSKINDADTNLVVKNFGPTPARGLIFEFDPPLQRAAAPAPHDVVLVPEMPYLAPGQEWQTWWDNGPARVKSDLPDTYAGRVTYFGLNNRTRIHDFVLDFGAIKARIYAVRSR